MSQVIIIEVGQAGLRIGDTCWQLFCLEHNIDHSGLQHQADPTQQLHNFFQQLPNGRFAPRVLQIDSDGYSIDEIKTGKLKGLFSRCNMVAGKEDSASNFIRGAYTLGRGLMEQSMEQLRRIVENCDHFGGIVYMHSIGGGTGSGFASTMSERINVDYSKKEKVAVTLTPSKSQFGTVVEPYNAVLSTSFMIDRTDANLVFRNSNIYDILNKQFQIQNPSFSEINQYIAQCFAAVTASMRFRGSLSTNLRDLVASIVPYHRLHCLMLNSISNDPYSIVLPSTKNLTRLAFNPVYSPYIRPKTYMAGALMYRGDVNHKDIVEELASIKSNKAFWFADWVPTGFRVGISDQKPKTFNRFQSLTAQRSVCFLSNNSAYTDYVGQINLKFDKMYAKRGFVHWYVGEGLDEGFFSQQRENAAALQKDYEFIDPLEDDGIEECDVE